MNPTEIRVQSISVPMKESEQNKILASRQAFSDYVYTPITEAVKLLKERREDKKLCKKIEEHVRSVYGEMPNTFQGEGVAVLCRQATPNYEQLRFLSFADLMDLQPVFWEYQDDKFVSGNLGKHRLGHLGFHYGFGKSGESKTEYMKVIDFSKEDGKKISQVKTLWGQDLMNFHHELFSIQSPSLNQQDVFIDGSTWFKRNGVNVNDSYAAMLTMFLTHGILFENFLLDGRELEFSRNVFLPAFVAVEEIFGCKPLIVPLDPIDVEGEEFWFCYPPSLKKSVSEKMENKLIINTKNVWQTH